MDGPHKRLAAVREKTGLSSDEVAQHIGISIEWYWDLECYADEKETCFGLRELIRLVTMLDVDPYWLVRGVENPAKQFISPVELAEQIKTSLSQTGRSLDAFEDEAGYYMSKFLEDPREIAGWNIDALDSVCRVLKIELGSLLNSESLRGL